MSSPKQIYGLIGCPVKHSLSGVMHNAAFEYYGINAEYRLFEVEPKDLEGFIKGNITVDGVSAKDVIGFNITIPHKVKAKEILEKIIEKRTGYIKLAGAVNTVKRESGGIDYDNTDSVGFERSLEKDLKLKLEDIYGRKVFIFGCGGAGRAAVAGLAWEEGLKDDSKIGKIYMYDKSYNALESARAHFSDFLEEENKKMEFIFDKNKIPEIIKDCRLLVNASPVGMKKGDASIFDKHLFHKDLYVYDVIYNRETQLIKDAKEKCKAVSGGLGMLLYQGVLAWEFWTGREAPVKIMEESLKKELKK
ncbi:MAG: shikimate dehydrogenase [Candidatus Omnitrophota bacterium]